MKQRELHKLVFDLGGYLIQLQNVALADSDKNSAAQVGMDAVSQFGTFILDFQQMRIDGKLKSWGERRATHPVGLTHRM